MQKRNVLLVVLLAIFTLALTLATLTGFASKKSVFAEGENGDAIKGINLSLNEDIVVKIHTRNVEGDYLVVNFNGKDTEIVENENGIFAFNGVTPQYLTENMAITLFNGEEEIDALEVSVKDYLKTLAVAKYDEQYGSPMQYDAMRELVINLLNYGAAAQNYKDVNLDKLANDDADINWDLGTPELKVNETHGGNPFKLF